MFSTREPQPLRKARSVAGRADSGLSGARSELWLPQPGLVACVRAAMARDTRGVPLTERQRDNHFPATPTCALLWYLHGECAVQQAPAGGIGAAPPQWLPQVSLCGPSTRPTISWNPGEMHAFMVLLMPDALHLLTGLDVAALVDRIVPADTLLDAAWQGLITQVQVAQDDDERVRCVGDFLLPRWRRLRPAGPLFGHHLSDWSQSLALRAASSSLGRSARQAERRIKRWTGQTRRSLLGLERSERTFFHAAATAGTGASEWSDIATSNGYADQSHLCRETRRVTGFSPGELRRLIPTEESLWAYRLWAFATA